MKKRNYIDPVAYDRWKTATPHDHWTAICANCDAEAPEAHEDEPAFCSQLCKDDYKQSRDPI